MNLRTAFRSLSQRIRGTERPQFHHGRDKVAAELAFWKQEAGRYVRWYRGEEPLYNFPCPKLAELISTPAGLPIDAFETWLHLFQTRKYREDLRLVEGALRNRRVLDVGCGPFPNLLGFAGCERHGIDPLIIRYQEAGYPILKWTEGYNYHAARAENMPFPTGLFDVVLSVNAIDHVDNFSETAREIRRVLRPDGAFRMHVHYHSPTETEPIELNDDIFLEHYSWVPGLKKIAVSNRKDCGLTEAGPGESYVVWSGGGL